VEEPLALSLASNSQGSLPVSEKHTDSSRWYEGDFLDW
ncbi:uncharacterized protein METZ01_LOCUS303488, partial [marine metagenome]